MSKAVTDEDEDEDEAEMEGRWRCATSSDAAEFEASNACGSSASLKRVNAGKSNRNWL